ncbi:acyltransferase domain-containing protein [Herbiconiux sp. CPCC 205763]|uniref:Acyltransferase domain-containing protein n=1 Tax=Herbiconiux aconitum TaxID=2970913 RepID=A0ABT2GLR3_9MICO|nr:acyltransferase domain-containing protein [Herbiconiux aconitum]MCS5717172.1 acyltransferase domain-containing protein [Herbiconiux aconitum]
MSVSLLGLAAPDVAAPDVAADPAFVEWLASAIEGDARADRAVGEAEAETATRRIRRPDPRPDEGRDVAHLAAAFLAVEPVAVQRHRRLGLSDEVTAATLADVGRKIDAYGASVDLSWLVGLARADVIALGRLQFERWASPEGRALHIPEGGPLDPRAVDDSLRQARELFGAGPIVCHTWLFDPALLALPAESNIVAFASRFETLPAEPDASEPAAADHAVAKFVFRRPVADVLDPARVVPRTAVERIVAERLRSGAHWSERRGILIR